MTAPLVPTAGEPFEILRCEVGSGLLGMAIEGHDDHDEMGVFVEPYENVVGLRSPIDTLTWRTKPEGVRSEAGDTDVVKYSLRHYLRLATKGNPTALLPLFAPPNKIRHINAYGHELRWEAERIVSKQVAPRFLGYLAAQKAGLLGIRKRPKRPELETLYGFDTKYAAHAVRLGMQAVEILNTGRLTLPMESADHLVDIKLGKISLPDVLAEVEDYEKLVQRIVDLGVPHLREEPDLPYLSRWSYVVHTGVWFAMDGMGIRGERLATGGTQ